MQHISPAQFNEWTEQASQQAKPLVLDVRETWECEVASIAPVGCEVQIMPMQTVPNRLHEIDRTRPIA